MMNAADNRVTSRLTQIMTQIKNYDTTSPRGERIVADGIADPAALALLKGFWFQRQSSLSGVICTVHRCNSYRGNQHSCVCSD